MAVDEAKLENWPGGANNRAPADRLPDGFVRDLVNLHPIGAKLRARPAAEKVVSGTDVRAAHPVSGGLLVVDGTNLMYMDLSYSSQVIGTVPAYGACAFATMDEVTYACVGGSTFRVVGTDVLSWGYPRPLGVTTSGDDTIRRKVACTFSDASGLEGGASDPIALGTQVTVPSPPAGCNVNVYASAQDGEELHFQLSSATGGTFPIGATNEEGAVLGTQHVDAPPPAELLAEYQSMVFGASGNVLYHTLPMQPNHTDLMEAFFYYPAPIVALAAGRSGVYVGADKLYLVSMRGSEARQSVVSEYPPVAGGLYTTERGEVAAMTRKGVHLEQSDQRGGYFMAPLTERNYDITPHSAGSLGEIDYDGEKLLVSSVTDRQQTGTGLSARDFFETEVIRP